MSPAVYPFTPAELSEIEKAIGHTFRDKQLLAVAFTHASLSPAYRSNERLEFLGDAVLQLAVTEMLYDRVDADEGKLTEMRKQYVSRPALERAESRARLMRFLRHAGGEENVGGKTASNLIEATIGALYLDGGSRAARSFLKKFLSEIETENYKTLLQEFVQEREKKIPCYHVCDAEDGFVCTVSAMGVSATGMGTSKKVAETAAAKALYFTLTQKNQRG